MKSFFRISKNILPALIMFFLFLGVADDAYATHYAGGYIRIECQGGNQYKIYVHRYRDLTGVPFGNTVPVNLDPVNTAEGNDLDFTANLTSVEVLPIPQTNPCHQPPEQSTIQLEEYIYETAVFTLNPASSGYNIYIDPACCRNGEIINIQPNSQLLFTRTADRREFQCNSSPEFTNIPPLELCIGDTLQFDASAEDPDGGFDKTKVQITQQPANGSVNVNPNNGKVTYIPNANFIGIDSFKYSVCDKGTPSECDDATVYVDVTYENIPPQATDDYMSTTVGVQVDKNIIANDSDFDDGLNPTSLKVLQNPSHGDIWYLSNGDMRYAPNGSFTGVDSMIYRICDAGNPIYCDTAKVYVTVSNSINPPLAADDYHTFNGSSTNIIILNNDDPFFSSISNPSIKVLKEPRHGDASVLVNKIFYLADKKSNGLDSLQYLVCNNENPASCDSAWVYIIRKPADYQPLALDDTFRVEINQPGMLDVLANDQDKVETLNYSGVKVTTKAWHGNATVGNAGIDYTPPAGFFGLDSFEYEICDPTPEVYCDVAKVYVLVENENYKPFAYDDQYLLDHNTSANFSVLANDFDKDGQLPVDGTLRIISGPSSGSASINGTSIDYTPNNGFNGIDKLSYEICDGGNPEKCDTATVTIFVKAVNYLPFVAADTALPYCFDPATINVLANDNVFNENLDQSTLTLITPPQNGTVTQNPNGTYTYQADSGYVGPDQFSYRICDDNGDCDSNIVYINSSSLNLPPDANDNEATLGENTVVILDLLKNDVDPEGLLSFESFRILSSVSNGTIYISQKGEVLYEPDANFVGKDSFTYMICDDGIPTKCDVATVRFTVIGNTPPQVNDDVINTSAFGPTAINVMSNDNIAAGSLDPQTLKLVTPPDHGLARIDFRNRFVYYPTDSSNSGTDQFTYSVCNDGTPKLCGTATVTINLEYNQPPLVNDDNITVEFGVPKWFKPLDNDSDPDGRIRKETIEIVSPPSNGDITILADSGFVYRPNNNYSGPDQLTYKVCDNGMSVYCRTANINITVGQKQAPVANDDQYQVKLNTVKRMNVTANDSDPDGDLDPSSVRVTDLPEHGYIFNNVDGQLFYHPDTDFFGKDSFEYQVSDGSNPLKLSGAKVTLTVAKDPSTPLATPDNFNLNKNEFDLFDIAANDAAGIDLSTFKILNYTNNGEAYINLSGLAYYKPDINFIGTDYLQYMVCDGPERLNCDTATVKFNVQDVSYPISANDDYVEVYDQHYRRIYVLENDFDKDRFTAGYTLSIVSAPTKGTARVDGDAINYNVTGGLGADQFTYEVCDNLGCETATVFITIVSGQNINPTARNDYWNTHLNVNIEGAPISNDVDPDKDSLSYRFCAALETNTPYNRAAMPPFPTVNYNAPYTPTYPVQSNPPLEIDPETGMLTGLPTLPGAHVITQCVEEYKNGRFLSDTRREIQVTIVQCTKAPNADIADDPNSPPGIILNCVDNTINFGNNGTADSFLWDFGIPGVASDTSSEKNPVFTYPDTGTYKVKLWAEPGAPCQDVDSILVKIYRSPIADFSYSTPLCSGISIKFKDSTNPRNGSIIGWNWQFSPTNVKVQPNPNFTYNTDGQKTVTLNVFASTGCKDNVTKTININPTPTISLPSTLIMCKNDTVRLEAQDSGATSITWAPEVSFRYTNDPAVIRLFPEQGRVYSVTASNQFGCEAKDDIVIAVTDRPIIDAGDPLRKCTDPDVTMAPSWQNVSFSPTFEWEPAASVANPSSPYTKASPSQTTIYTLTISSKGEYCIESDTVRVHAELPALNLVSEKDVLCANDFTRLSAQTNTTRATFDWQPAASLSDPTSQYPFATPAATTTYTLTMYDSVTQCTVMDTIKLKVKAVAGLSAGPDTTICRGDTTQLFATNGSRFIWSQDTTLSCQCCESPKVWPLETNTYTLSGVDTNGCKVTDEVTVFVDSIPFVEAKSDTAICPGEPVDIRISGANEYIWLDDPSKNCTNCNSISLQPMMSKTYVVAGIDNNGCASTDTVTIDVFPPPQTGYTSPPELCKGDTTQLALNGGAVYNWSPDSSLSNPNIGDPLAFPDVTTFYTVTGTDTNGCAFADTIQLIVNVLQPSNFIADTSICIGEDVELFAKGFTEYAWSPDSTLSCDSCATPLATPLSTTTYKAVVADDNGCVDSGEVTITVNPLPTVLVSAPEDTLCEGESIQITATGGVDYSWLPTLGLDDPNIANPVASPSDDVTYTVTVADANGCINDTFKQIVVNPLPTTFVGNDTAMCWQDTLQLNAVGADSFSWQGNQYISCTDCPDPMISPQNTSTYTVTGFNQYNCTLTDEITVTVNPEPSAISISNDTIICFGDSTQLEVTGGDSYQWLPSSSLSCETCADPIAKPTTDELFSVQVFTDQGCYRYFDVEVEVQELPVPQVTSDTGVCITNSLTLEASGGTMYEWTPNAEISATNIASPVITPTQSRYYVVKVSDDLGCFSKDSTYVEVYIPMDPNAQPDTIICEFQPLMLSAENGAQYTWTPAALLDDPTIANPMTSLTQSQQFVVEIIDSNGCYNSDTIFADVKPSPQITVSGDVYIYKGASTTLAVSGANEYEWEPTVGIIDSGAAFITVQPGDTVSYTVTAFNQFGCYTSDSMLVTPVPELELYMPNAFTPNGDGRNDRFAIKSNDNFELLHMNVFDRWGNVIYSTDNPSQGWDGRVGGSAMPMGTYIFTLEVRDQVGNTQTRQGNFILIR